MRAKRFWRDRAGVTAVEFSLLSPVFFALAFGAVDAGRVVWTQMTLAHAVESAARCAALRSCVTAADVQASAVAQAPGLGVTTSAFTYTTSSCGAQVSASFTFYFLSAAFSDASTTLTATSCLPFASDK